MHKSNKNEKLDVYYISDTNDIDLERSLRLQLSLNCKNYSINKLVNCETLLSNYLYDHKEEEDIIKNGLLTFNKMFENLKLKSTNETWFFYVSSGNVKDIYRDVFVVLLNKNPREQKCFYVINKNNICKNKESHNIKIVNSTICEVLYCEKTITYANLT